MSTAPPGAAPGTGSQRGEPPTLRTDGLEQAAAELAPHHSLARVDSAAKAMLGMSGLVGSVITAFGALGSDAVREHPSLALPALVLSALALACASWASVGSVEKVNVDDLSEVESFYAREIERRGTLVRASGVLLGLAILLALLPMLACT